MGTSRLLLGIVATVLACGAAEPPGAWIGPYAPCDQALQLKSSASMNVGVRFSTANALLATAFSRALDFWSSVLDLKWHEENSRQCAIQVLDGDPRLFARSEVARAQFPGAPPFQGWIAFNPRIAEPPFDMFLTSVHEIGHLMGLGHNRSADSIMYFLRLDGPRSLDESDLAALALRHRLRAPIPRLPALRIDFRRLTAATLSDALQPPQRRDNSFILVEPLQDR